MPGALDHSPADVLRYMMIDMGMGVLPSAGGTWPIYEGVTPGTPDALISTHNTTDIHQGREMVFGEVQGRHGVQILVRAATDVITFAKTNDIVIAFDEQTYDEPVIIGSSTYVIHSISRSSGPIHLGKEVPDTKRDLYTLNVTISVRQTS